MAREREGDGRAGKRDGRYATGAEARNESGNAGYICTWPPLRHLGQREWLECQFDQIPMSHHGRAAGGNKACTALQRRAKRSRTASIEIYCRIRAGGGRARVHYEVGIARPYK